MGLFDSIRRVVGGDDGTAESDEAATQPAFVDTRDLEVSALRERAAGVAGEVDVLDFSLSSLEQFDEAIDAGYDEVLATSDEPATYATDTVRFGCYLGEVLVRTYGGEWTRNPDWGVTVSGPDGTTTVAVFDVSERSITTDSVFAAVADRAAVEVGLDGPAAGSDPEPSLADSADSDPEPATADSDTGGDGTADDGDDTAVAVDGEPTAEGPSGGGPAAETPAPDTAADESAGVPDSAAADPTLTEADREAVDRVAADADTESLIEEAEPEPSDAPDPSPTPVEDGTDSTDESDRDASPSLFDDGSAGAGPTVADAPSADDGPQAPTPESHDGSVDDGAADGTDTGAELSEDPDTATPDATAGDGLRATYAEAADELVSFWTEYDLDYTPDSLERLDALVSEEWDDDRFDDADFGSDDSFDDRVFTSVSTELGSYFGEVLVRELDAEWSDETATDAVVVEGVDGPLAIPVFKVAGTSITQQPVFARSYASLLSDLDG